jgi:enamine deaminase RidA (YjgF/YER057c/UK114 family)
MERQRIPARSRQAAIMGYSRAMRVGPNVFVGGTAPVMPEGEDPPADAYGQALRCLEIIVDALREAGAEPEHVVRTRIFATDAGDFDQIARAHDTVFRNVRPASTCVLVQLLDPRWRVEIEAEALIA